MKCTKCQLEKPISEFYLRKDRAKRYHSRCKACICQHQQYKNYHPMTTGTKSCVYCNLDKSILDFFKNKRNKDGRDIRCKDCENIRKIKLLNDHPRLRVIENIRRRTRAVLRGDNKSASTLTLIGCSRDGLIAHLEAMFEEGMSWDNYGEWHIDHIKPCAMFDLGDAEQQKQCFHYSNLRPMWAEDNLRKGKRYE